MSAIEWMMESAPGPETVFNGRRFLYFAGTGYLGLQSHPEVIAAAQAAVAQYGVHSATSPAGMGTTPLLAEVQCRAAEFFSTEAAVYLMSGYVGNFAIMSILGSAVDLALIDESAHFCLQESLRWCDHLKMPPLVFRNRDPQHIADLLKAHFRPGWKPLIVTDGVFATRGDIAPLQEYLNVLVPFDRSMLLIDDAHGVGAIGANGRGSLELADINMQHANCSLDDPAVTGPRVFFSATLSKALGGYGGVIAGSHSFIKQVRQAGGWYRGASAPAAAVAGATAKALEIVQANPGLRNQLAHNVRQLRTALQELRMPVEITPSPVVGFSVGDAKFMAGIREYLIQQDIMIAYSRSYAGTGPEGSLRIAVFATHTPGMIDRLIATFRDALSACSYDG